MATDDRFLHIMQQHPEMIQQVRDQLGLFLSPFRPVEEQRFYLPACNQL